MANSELSLKNNVAVAEEAAVLERSAKEGEVGRGFSAVVSYIDSLPLYGYSAESPKRLARIVEGLSIPQSSRPDVIMITGTNGKSTAAKFVADLLNEVGVPAVVYSPNYVVSRLEHISSPVIPVTQRKVAESFVAAVEEGKKLHGVTQHEILAAAAFHFAAVNLVRVLVVEAAIGGQFDACTALKPRIVAMTNVDDDPESPVGRSKEDMARDFLLAASGGSVFLTSEQGKAILKKMREFAEVANVDWRVPVRKIAEMPYPYHQMFGRIGALAERVAQIYYEEVLGEYSAFLRGANAAIRRGLRGRPKLGDLPSPQERMRSLRRFWEEHISVPFGRFEVVETKSGKILISLAENASAIERALLGLRLIGYREDVTEFVVACAVKTREDVPEIARLFRSFMRRYKDARLVIVQSVDSLPVEVLKTELERSGVRATSLVSIRSAIELFERMNVKMGAVFGTYGLVGEAVRVLHKK